jgi:pyruvate dehydrogenase E2 component (dihydrolipoamide acetyltransferase)
MPASGGQGAQTVLGREPAKVPTEFVNASPPQAVKPASSAPRGAQPRPPDRAARPPAPAARGARPAAEPSRAKLAPQPKGLPSGKSKFPARAGFWGRRDTAGDLVPLTDPAMSPVSSSDLAPVPSGRRRLLQSLGIVAASAGISFLIAWTLLEARRPMAPVVSAPATPSRAPEHAIPVAPPLPAPAPAPAAAAPAPPHARPERPAHRPPARRSQPAVHREDELLRPTH